MKQNEGECGKKDPQDVDPFNMEMEESSDVSEKKDHSEKTQG
jgi:hypothetical protein